MKFRHAATLALTGWYLMLPPHDREVKRYADESAPLTQWTQLLATDTAKECEDAKMELHERMKKNDQERAEFELSASCIESTDPRLKPN
jgi:hypothetical protein